MRIHPDPRMGSIVLRRDIGRSLSAALGRQKKLCRLPHIFSKVLELPFGANADVDVHEDAEAFRFAVVAEGFRSSRDIRAQSILICPGVMKVVIRDGDDGDEALMEDLELDRWRFRLPQLTQPALATAEYVDGELVVIIPKGPGSDEEMVLAGL